MDLITILFVDIRKQSKIEFLAWFILLIFISYFIYDKPDKLLESLQLSQLAIVIIRFVFTIIIDTFVLMLIARFYRLDCLIKYRSKCRKDLKDSIKNITYHLLQNSTVCNLYGSLLLSKLVGEHFPKANDQIGDAFYFIRHEMDFIAPHSYSMGSQKGRLIEYQIEDFYTIQSCIRKSWDTVAYGDISVLLEKPIYIARNIKMINSRKKIIKKISLRRLFIWPYCDMKNFDNLLKSLKSLKVDPNDIIFTPTSGLQVPMTDFESIKTSLSISDDMVARAIRDLIYLLWLIRIHEEYRIDYRVITRNATSDGSGIDIVGNYLLDNWRKEGSALIDEEVIVKFDDKMGTNGLIIYEFIRDRSKVEKYKETFETLWSEAMPKTYKLEGDGNTGGLDKFLEIFFNENVVSELMKFINRHESVNKWIDNIKNELKNIKE